MAELCWSAGETEVQKQESEVARWTEQLSIEDGIRVLCVTYSKCLAIQAVPPCAGERTSAFAGGGIAALGRGIASAWVNSGSADWRVPSPTCACTDNWELFITACRASGSRPG